MPLAHLPIPLLRTAIKIREKIDSLTSELISLVGREVSAVSQQKSTAKGRRGKKGKRTLSPEARAKISAAQARRWAKVKGRSSAAKPAAKAAKSKPGKRVLSPEARAKIAAAQKRRWAKVRRG